MPRFQFLLERLQSLLVLRLVGQVGDLVGIGLQVIEFMTRTVQVGVDRSLALELSLIHI